MRRGFRNSTLAGSWTSSIRENFYECVDPDPAVLQIWCYSDALSYPPGADVSLHIATTAASYDIDIWRDGVNTHRLYSAKDLEGNWPDTPEDCSVVGCGWPVALRLKLPRDCPSGGYVVITRCRDASGARAEHHHVFLVRGAPERPADMLLLAATSTWCAYNDWGGSNHYDGITGPGRNRFSPILSTQRPWSRGFVTLPKGAPRIPLREPPTPGPGGERARSLDPAFAGSRPRRGDLRGPLQPDLRHHRALVGGRRLPTISGSAIVLASVIPTERRTRSPIVCPKFSLKSPKSSRSRKMTDSPRPNRRARTSSPSSASRKEPRLSAQVTGSMPPKRVVSSPVISALSASVQCPAASSSTSMSGSPPENRKTHTPNDSPSTPRPGSRLGPFHCRGSSPRRSRTFRQTAPTRCGSHPRLSMRG